MGHRVTTLWCVRHAPVDAQGICYGQHDVPTRIDAPEAAAIVARALDGVRFTSVHASPWARARLVGEALAALAHVPLVVDARLSELSMGEWEGRAFAEIEASDADRFAQWMRAWRTQAPPGGETIAALVARVGAWLDERDGGTHVVIAHAGVVRAIRTRARSIAYEDAMNERVEHLAPERVDLILPSSSRPPSS